MEANERAAQIWSVLAWAATSRQVLTYRILGKLIGVPARGLGPVNCSSPCSRTASFMGCRR